ncbi:MAG: alpha/beta hydrolase [Thermoleophilia bacterium]
MRRTVHELGSGPHVLMVNGWRCPPHAWAGVDRAVAAAGFRVTCTEPPHPVLGGGPVAVADWLAEEWRDRDAPYAVIGYSLGAQAALMLASRLPRPPERLVLLAPLVLPVRGPSWLPHPWRQVADLPVIARMLLRAGRAAVRGVPKPRWDGTVSVPSFLTTVTRSILSAPVRSSVNGLAAAMAFDLRPEAAGVRVPTLVISGEHDFMSPAAGAVMLADALGDAARLLVVPGAGHFMHLEDPKVTIPPILRHLGGA